MRASKRDQDKSIKIYTVSTKCSSELSNLVAWKTAKKSYVKQREIESKSF